MIAIAESAYPDESLLNFVTALVIMGLILLALAAWWHWSPPEREEWREITERQRAHRFLRASSHDVKKPCPEVPKREIMTSASGTRSRIYDWEEHDDG